MENSIKFTIYENFNSLDDVSESIKVRHEVFQKEFNIFLPDNDVETKSVLIELSSNDKVVGSARMGVVDGKLRIGLVGILKEERGKGFGKAIMLEAKRIAIERGFSQIHFKAREQVVPFYLKLGAVCLGEAYLFEDRMLQDMVWKLE